MATHDTAPPTWFWIASALALLWSAAGIFAFYMHLSVDAAGLAAMSDYDRQSYLALPSWFTWVFAIATGPALLGSIALLARLRLAGPLFLVSLIGVIIQFGWVFGGTDLIAVKGAAATVPFPFLIFLLAIIQLWFAQLSARRGWLR